MAKKPLRVFKANSGSHPSARQPVYKDSADVDRASITQEVLEVPQSQVDRSRSAKADRYTSLLHCIYDAVLVTDSAGAIIEVNARAEHVFSFGAEDLKSMNVTNLIAGADKELLRVLQENISEKRFTLLEAVCVRSDDTRFHAEIVVNRINITSSSNLCFFIRDISDRKEAEAQLSEANERLVEAERMQSRVDTLATLYHELNNPMQIMMCMAELDANPEYRKQLGRIMSVLEQLRTEEPMDAIVDEEGVSRYEIQQEATLEDADPQRILIVDDEEMLRRMFEATISQTIPYLQIDAVESGAEAIELYKKHHHALVIMDISMPRMSGEEAFARINAASEEKKWKPPRFVFCTGFVVSDNLHSIVGDGSVHACLKKPLAMSDLVNAVQTRLAGAAQE